MVRSRRTVGCLRTTRPLMGRRRQLGPSRGGRRRPVALARPGQPDRRCAAGITGLSALAYDSGPGRSPALTVRDQSLRPLVVTRRDEATRQARVGVPSTAPARSVAGGGTGGRFLHPGCSRLRCSNLIPAHSGPRPARAYPDPCVPAAQLPPVRQVDFAPQVLAAPAPASGTPVETPTGSRAGSRRAVRPARSVAWP